MERQEEFNMSDDEMGYLAGSMFGAGSDTVRDLYPSSVLALTDLRCRLLACFR